MKPDSKGHQGPGQSRSYSPTGSGWLQGKQTKWEQGDAGMSWQGDVSSAGRSVGACSSSVKSDSANYGTGHRSRGKARNQSGEGVSSGATPRAENQNWCKLYSQVVHNHLGIHSASQTQSVAMRKCRLKNNEGREKFSGKALDRVRPRAGPLLVGLRARRRPGSANK